MAVRANWHVDLDVPEDTEQLEIETVGKPIDLRGEPRLNERLAELVAAEAALYERGVTCAVKDRSDTACSACPIRSEDANDPLAALCRVGSEQERVLTSLAVQRERSCGRDS